MNTHSYGVYCRMPGLNEVWKIREQLKLHHLFGDLGTYTTSALRKKPSDSLEEAFQIAVKLCCEYISEKRSESQHQV